MNPISAKIIEVGREYFQEAVDLEDMLNEDTSFRDIDIDEEVVWEEMGRIEELSTKIDEALDWPPTDFGD